LASLYRLDVLIRGNSDISQDDAIEWTHNWVNRRQESDDNKDDDGNYLKEYYSDLYDSRTNRGWKVFSDVATKNRTINNSYECDDGSVIKGVIYTLPFGDMVDDLSVRVSFVEAQLKQETPQDSNVSGVKILV